MRPRGVALYVSARRFLTFTLSARALTIQHCAHNAFNVFPHDAFFLAVGDKSFLWNTNLLLAVCLAPDIILPFASLCVGPLHSVPSL